MFHVKHFGQQCRQRGCAKISGRGCRKSRELKAGAGVGVAVFLLNVGTVHVGVYLGSGNVRVTQKLLDNAQVGTTFQQMRGERMPQRMRMQILNANGKSRMRHNGMHTLT